MGIWPSPIYQDKRVEKTQLLNEWANDNADISEIRSARRKVDVFVSEGYRNPLQIIQKKGMPQVYGPEAYFFH